MSSDYETVSGTFVSELHNQLKDMNSKQRDVVKQACQQLLRDHQDDFRKALNETATTKTTKSKSKSKSGTTKTRTKTWSDYWRSKDYGAKKYFPEEYEKVKLEAAGTKTNHFTWCKTLQQQLESTNRDRYLGWAAEVRKVCKEAPADDPVVKTGDKAEQPKRAQTAASQSKKTDKAEKTEAPAAAASGKGAASAAGRRAPPVKVAKDSDAESSAHQDDSDSE